MQENQNSLPNWLQKYMFVDIKDKSNQWKVGLILNTTGNHIKVRYDGQSHKYDDTFNINSPNVKPFRSYTRGCNTLIQSQVSYRQQYTFSQENQKQKQKRLDQFMANFSTKSQFQITQYVRGQHYFWLDYLLSVTYKNATEINLVYEYFFKHFQLVNVYLQEMLKSQDFDAWFSGRVNGQFSESMKAFAECCYEIADSVYSLGLEGNSRLKTFIKNNQKLITQFVGQNQNHVESMHSYLQQIGVTQYLQEVMVKIMNDNKSIIKLDFMTAIGRLFLGLQKSIKQKQKRRQQAIKLCKIMTRQCQKMHEISQKQVEIEIEKIYAMIKSFYHKYQLKQTDLLVNFQNINMMVWKSMIISQKLQRKIKGIYKLKHYYSQVTANNKQFYLIFNSRETVNGLMKKLQIFNAIFYENQHHEIIKKGCQLAFYLYKENCILIGELEIIWNSCRKRLEAVRKVMYSFFQSICKQLKKDDLARIFKLIISQKFEEIDKNFFYTFFGNAVQSAKQQKAQILQQMFKFSYERILQSQVNHKKMIQTSQNIRKVRQIPQQARQFAQILTLNKSQKLEFTQKYANMFIKQISMQKYNDSMFYINLVNLIYSLNKTKNLDIQSSCFNKVFASLKNTLNVETTDKNPQIIAFKHERIAGLLKLFQNICSQFQLEHHQFLQLWSLFQNRTNTEFKQQQFLPWMIKTTYKGVLKLQHEELNHILSDSNLKKEMFISIFKKNSTNIDIFNISEMQFKIFKKLQLQVNRQMKNIQQFHQNLTGIHYFRVSQKAQNILGLRQLIDIMINCRSQHVAKKAVRLIKQFHLNYKSDVDPQFRVRKIEELMLKIYKYVGQAFKKSNIKLIRNMLHLLYEIVVTVKQIIRLPHLPSHSYFKPGKKIIKVSKDDLETKDFEIPYSQSLKTLKNMISKSYNVPLYNLKLYKFSSKKADDTEDFYSDASAAGSSHSATYTKNSPKFNAKATQPQQMAFQSLAGPVYTLTISDPQARLVVKEKPNILYQSISKFVCEKMSDQLLKILGDSQAFTKQSSQLAYHILIQIPSSMQSLEILNNLINQLKNKSTQLGMGINQNHKKIDLSLQSINFRMYFCKNINRLKDNEFGHFLSQENVKNYEGIFTQISNRIIQNEQIQLIIQIINLAKRAISKMLISQNILNTENIFQCIINLMQFIIGPKNTEQFKKQQKYDQFDIEKKVFYQCLNVIELMHQNNKGRIVDTIVQSEYFQKLFVYLFKSMPKTQFADIFANKLDKFFKYAYKQRGYLEDKTQSKLCNVIFDVLYENVIKNKTRRNTAFFKIIRDLISISSSHSIQKLFTRDINNQKPSFWENCLNIIHQQSDFHNSQEKQNTFLTGHLYIVDSIIRRNPSIIDLNLCKMIFYNCLCYKQEETISEEVKCVSKSSINAALSAIYSMCCSNQLYVKFIVSELRRYQQIQYWRTPDFWAINSQLQAKSQCGFVGLVNPGCICYLNSFTQTLFMNEEFRNKVINFKEVNKATDYSLLIEMRKLFMYLQYSNQKSLSSVPFSQSIKSDQGKSIIKIFQQMDIEEYSSILFDRIQKILPKDQDFVKEIFGGTYSNDIISQQCKHSSQKQQNFLSMQVDLKPNLQQSLKTLVKGQILQGQNAYFCQKCNRKVKAVKRMSIKKLPNYLIISLKRFQYNFEIEGKIKINSLCEFSKQLSLQPYSQQFLNQEQDCNIRVEDPQTESQSQPHEYFNYKLKGVIIHTGSSQSGHYYTIIETSPDTWLQFNDSSVTEFDINKLPDEAFGCDDHSNPRAARNAYMLIYERKKKIYPMKVQKMQNQSQNSKETYTEQAYSIYNEIRTNNKQIQTFHLVFGAQYFNFVKQLIALAKKQNYALKQFQKQMHIDKNISNLNLSDKQKLLHQQKQNQVIVVKQNKYSTDTIIQVLKFYFQYCIFIRARQANINAFLDCLQDLESMLSSSFCVRVLDYIIYELSQKLVIEQLLVQVSNKQKIIILSHFFLNILKLRITWWKSHYNTQTLINIMRLIQSFMQVIIQNSNCMNQILFIIRSIVEEDERILQYCQQINIFGNVFEIVSGVNQSDDQRLNKVQVLKKQVDYFIKKLVNSDGNQMEQMKQNQMVQQINEYFHNYSIRPVKKTGKCVLKLESPQQAWTYLYYIYKIQSQIYRKQELQNISSPQNSNQNQSSNQNQNSKSQFITIICHRKQFYQSEFIKLKDVRISHFIAESYGYRSSSALALFLCQMMNENQKIAQKIMNIIKDGLKKFQAIKFRPFLIVLFYVVMHEDSVQEFRNSFGIKLLTYALMENAKYFSQTDILHQWTIKMCLASGQFTQTIARTDEGSEILKQILSKVQIIKPTSEMMKKQKNAHYERLNYQIHGLMVSTEYQDYDRLKDIKRQFFQDIFHERPLSQEVKYQTKLLQFPQPTYAELTHRIVPGDILTYLFGRKWINVFVKSYRYGILKVHKIIKDTEKQKQKEIEKGKKDQVGNWKKKDNENKTSFIRINNKNIEIGSDNRLSEEQFTIYENDERLKNISQLKKYISKELQSQNNNKYTSNKDKTQKKINIQNDQQRSDLSYQSDNQG